MSEATWVPHHFRCNDRSSRVLLPFRLSEMLEAYSELRTRMIRNMPEEFARDEWAYLLQFADPVQLFGLFENSFGAEAEVLTAVDMVCRPRGKIAVWLPNNVSLLGPLLAMQASVTGNPITFKTGSDAVDLVSALREFVLEYSECPVLADYFSEAVEIVSMGRDDPRQNEVSNDAAVRIAFGSDEAARGVDSLDHRPDAPLFSFIDRSSEAWIDSDQATDQVLSDLIKVFAIYGKAGCTSPRRVILLNGTRDGAIEIRDRLCALWPRLVKQDTQPHHASENVMAAQWAAALGWDVAVVERNRGLVAVGEMDLPEFDSYLSLPVIPATIEQACKAAPDNLQTIGLAGGSRAREIAAAIVEGTRARRIVDIASMHHFEGVWDGFPFWSQLFEYVPIELGRGQAG